MFEIIATAGRWSVAMVIVLGIVGGIFVSRRVLIRVDAMTDTARTIMAGNLSGRLPVTGTGDEFDRLASNLNGMLERIESLMHGLKEVSDNVAHDLKTPLTRLRNRCEEALRLGKSEREYRSALEATIEESEGLIRTFDALLMIARAESGEARDGMREFDAAEIARDVGELYEPLADEKGLSLQVEASTPARVKGNRELVSQALANLVDNAIKHAATIPPAQWRGRRRGRFRQYRRRPHPADGTRQGTGIPPADRPRAVGRLCASSRAARSPDQGSVEPCGGSREAAWWRTSARGQRTRAEGRDRAAARDVDARDGMT